MISSKLEAAVSESIEHAVVDEEIITSRRRYHTITESKNGAGAVPIKTDRGWLHIAHGVRNTAAGLRYVLYVFVTALDEPWRVIAEPGGLFLGPRGEERVGDVSNVVFTNGAVDLPDGRLFIYYASSDTRLHVAETTIERMLDYAFSTPPDSLRSHDAVMQRLKLIDENDPSASGVMAFPHHIGYKTGYRGIDWDSFNEKTLDKYLNALNDLFVIKDIEAWNPNIRSKAKIQNSPIRHFCDPSIATASLRIGPKDLINDLKTFGLFFESMCVHDLSVYSERLDGDVFHYRDSNGLEADAVIHLKDGRYGLIEIKLGRSDDIEEAAKHLKKLAGLIDTQYMNPPSFLLVITAKNTAYKRDDGVYVSPLGCLTF